MEFDHNGLVAAAKSFGLFYLIGLSIIVVAYTYWPGNKKKFDRAAQSIFVKEDE